jgi:hypothetical protein
MWEYSIYLRYVRENYGTPDVSTPKVKDPMNTSLGQRFPPITWLLTILSLASLVYTMCTAFGHQFRALKWLASVPHASYRSGNRVQLAVGLVTALLYCPGDHGMTTCHIPPAESRVCLDLCGPRSSQPLRVVVRVIGSTNQRVRPLLKTGNRSRTTHSEE